jgi:purine-nucleoside phosphorylase
VASFPPEFAAARSLDSIVLARPRAGIILGTGLGPLVGKIEERGSIEYADLPPFGQTTAPGHRGRMIFGHWDGVPVVALQGRFHLYEGRSPESAVLPVRVLAALGAEVLIVTSACGGLNPRYRTGELVILDDHVNLTFRRLPLGTSEEMPERGTVDLAAPYDRRLAETAMAAARHGNIPTHRGVYAGVLGPNYETRAEYRFLRRIGADVVGMSTVLETTAAVSLGMRVLGISVVTNLCRPDAPTRTTAESVLYDASLAAPQVGKVIAAVLRTLAESA